MNQDKVYITGMIYLYDAERIILCDDCKVDLFAMIDVIDYQVKGYRLDNESIVCSECSMSYEFRENREYYEKRAE